MKCYNCGLDCKLCTCSEPMPKPPGAKYESLGQMKAAQRYEARKATYKWLSIALFSLALAGLITFWACNL